MDNTQARLTNCFLAVFPELTSDQVASATSATVHSWDSVAGVTLLAVVEEEFCIPIGSDDLSRFGSFQGFLTYLRGAGNGHASEGS
jgi:acyl carrier protein